MLVPEFTELEQDLARARENRSGSGDIADREKLLETGEELIRRYEEAALWNRALQTAENLLDYARDETEARHRILKLYMRLGRKDEVLSELKTLARLHGHAEEVPEEIRCHERILQLEPENEESMARLQELLPPKSPLLWILMSLILLVGAGAGGYYFFGVEARAQAAMDDAIETASESLAAGEYDAARSALDKALEGHGMSRTAAKKDALLEQIDELETRQAVFQKRKQIREAVAAFESGRVATARQLLAGVEPPDETAEARVAELKSQIDDRFEAAEAIYERGRRAERRGKINRTLGIYEELLEAHPWYPGLERLTVDVPIETTPEGARITIDGNALQKRTPATVPMKFVKGSTLELDRESTEKVVLQLNRKTEFPLHVVLPRPTKWKVEFGSPVEWSPGVLGDTVFVALRNRALVGVRKGNGLEMWRRHLGVEGDPVAGPVLFKEVGVLAGRNGTVIGVFPKSRTGDGWETRVPGPVTDCGATPVSSQVAVVGSGGRVLYLLENRTGKLVRKVELPMTAFLGPATDERLVLAGEKTVLRIDPRRGRIDSKFALPSTVTSRPAYDRRLLFVPVTDSLMAIDPRTGKTRWTRELKEPIYGLTAVRGKLYFGEGNQFITCEAQSGEETNRLGIDSPLLAPPAVQGTRIAFGTEGGRLRVINRLEHRVLWQYQAEGPIRAVHLTENLLLVGSDDGVVACFSQ